MIQPRKQKTQRQRLNRRQGARQGTAEEWLGAKTAARAVAGSGKRLNPRKPRADSHEFGRGAGAGGKFTPQLARTTARHASALR